MDVILKDGMHYPVSECERQIKKRVRFYLFTPNIIHECSAMVIEGG